MPGFSEEKQKKQIRVTYVDNDLVAFGILSRLPVKSLMRFKSVCKPWKSTIEKDAHFINLHSSRSRSQGLFIVSPTGPIVLTSDKKYCPRLGGRRQLSLLSLDLHSDHVDVRSIRTIDPLIDPEARQHVADILRPIAKVPWQDVVFLGPVRGLLCLVDRWSVRIFNVITGVAVTPWIKSIVLTSTARNQPEFVHYPRCSFGFDGENYKAVFLWSKFLECPPVCEVLTVGSSSSSSSSSSWRIIDSIPPYQPAGQLCSCSKGSVYWFTKEYYWGDGDGDGGSDGYVEFLVAFDIGSEQFRTITIPKFTRIPPEDNSPDLLYPAVTDMDGCPALYREDICTLTMWKFRDNKESSSSSEKDWTGFKIRRPSCLGRLERFIAFHSIPGKDLLILETYDSGSKPVVRRPFKSWRNVKRAVFFRWDLKDETLIEFQVRGISDLPDDCVNNCATLVESLFAV